MNAVTIPTWSDNTREERFFTAMLFSELLKDAQPFWRHLAPRLGERDETRVTDVGYEVCLFRDLAHANHIPPTAELRKQTIDLVLTVSSASIVLIEAKAHQSFSLEQARNLQLAKVKLLQAGLGVTSVHLVGLHSSRYKPTRVKEKCSDLVFTTWAELRGVYPDIARHIDRADEIYAN